jgi:hypothetical protein
MSDAWLVDEKTRDNRSKIFIFSVANVAVSDVSSEIVFNLKNIKSGTISSCKIKCSSTDFDFDLFSKTGQTYPSPYQIFRIEENNLEGSGADIGGTFINFDNPQEAKIYGVITNNDGINATGVIYITLEIYY